MPGMADIVARLSLNGSQFSAELAKQFGQVEAAARDTAARTQSAFEGSFNQIQQLAQRALSMPRNAGGSLDLGVGAAKDAAAAAHAQALALREVALASESAAKKVGDTSENTRLYVQAARAAANEAELAARGAREHAMALDTLQAELNQTRSATDVVIQGNRLLNQSHDTVARSSGTSRMAMVQASQQVQDFFIQVGGGQRILTAFTQQASQMAYVMQGATGVMGGAARILSGGWGSAIFAGSSLLSLFSLRHKEAADTVETLTKKLIQEAEKARMSEEAQRAWASSADGAAASIKKITDELSTQNRTLDQNIRLMQEKIRQNVHDVQFGINKESGQLRDLQDQLARAKDDLAGKKLAAGGSGQGAEVAAIGLASAQGKVDALQRQISDLQAHISRLQTSVASGAVLLREANLPLLNRNVEESLNAEGKAARALRLETERLTKAKIDGAISDKAYEDGKRKAQQAYDAELKRIRKEEADHKKAAETELTQFRNPVGGGAVTGRFGEQRPGHRHGGIDLAVPVGTDVMAAAGGTVIEAGVLGDYGNVIIINHGRGTITRYAHLSSILAKKGDVVEGGQVIALSGGARGAAGSGNSQGPHLHYEVRRGGKAVDPRTGLYPTDDLGSQIAGAHDAERDAKAQAKAREELEKYVELQRQSLDIMGMRIQGLNDEGDLQKDINSIERDYAERIKELPEAQRGVSAALADQIEKIQDQSLLMEGLLKSHGDRETLTQAEKDAEEAVLGELRAQLVAAEALAKTDEERLRLAKARSIVEARLGQAMETGDQTGKEEDRKAEKAQREWEKWNKERTEQQKKQINDLADFYERAFSTGGKSIWDDFKSQGKRALALLAAQWTMALLSGQKVSFGSILSQIGATTGNGMGGSGNIFASLFGGGGGGSSGILGSLFGGGGLGGGGSFGGGGGGGDFLSSISTATGNPFGGMSGGITENGALGQLSGGTGALGGATLGLSAAGSALTGMVMSKLGYKSAGSSIGGAIGGIVGSMTPLGPIGGLIGSVIGSVLGGLIGGKEKKPNGETNIIFKEGSLSLGRSTGPGEMASQNQTAANSIIDSLNQVAEALGATIDGTKISVGIGQRNGKWVVDELGQGRTKGVGTPSFATAEEAVRYAIKDALKDGVITGLSQASMNLFKSTTNIDAALKKASLIEGIPKRLKAMLDPVGAAIDELNKKWRETVAALREGGASTEQMAEAQKLYKMELEDTKASTQEASANLKAFLDGLKFGSSSPYSLRDQEGAAREKLQPFLDKIQAGDRIDQSAFTDAAGKFLDIERALYGSTGKFFEAMDLIQGATGKAISTIDNAVPIRTISDPFNEATATNTGTTAGNTGTTNEILDQVSGQLGNIINLLGGGTAGAAGAAANDFIGDAATSEPRDFFPAAQAQAY